MGAMPIYFFDIDGVLINVRKRIEATLISLGLNPDTDISKLRGSVRRRFWEYFLSERFLHYDEPREVGIRLLADRLKKGSVILLTGRPDSLRYVTLRELSYYGIPISKVKVIFRKKGDFRKDFIFKKSIVASYDNIAEVHDDSIEVLEAIAKLKKNIKLYLHFNNSYTLYKVS